MISDLDSGVRQHLIKAMQGGQAFDTFDSILADIPVDLRFVVPPGGERSAWQIVEHMRIALKDIVDFTDNADGGYRELDWPAEYWPITPAPTTEDGWNQTRQGYRAARSKMEELVLDPKRELLEPFPWGDGQTLFRQALLMIDHDAHHLGQLVELTRWLRSMK